MRHGLLMLGLLAVAGCNPYKNLDGDFAEVQGLDGTKFSAAYRGDGASDSAAGTFTTTPAIASGGAEIDFFAFPTVAGNDPTLIDSGSGRQMIYIFDGDSTQDSSKCKPKSPNYVYDAYRDAVRYDRQGNIFEDLGAVLPDDPGYEPVYSQVDVTSINESCNSIHSAEYLVKDTTVSVKLGTGAVDHGAHQIGVPDGKYLAVAAIDPVALVLRPDGTVDNVSGNGSQRWGWYDHYLAAYIEGGTIPVDAMTMPDPNGGPDTTIQVAETSTIYIPNTVIVPADPADATMTSTTTICDLKAPAPCIVITDSVDAMGNPVETKAACPADAAAPCLNLGFSLMSGTDGASPDRKDPGYSPICSVRTFKPADPTAPESDPDAVDPQSLDDDAGVFVYCFQVVQ